ncbi:carbohydrate ABC transporter permease [Micromonospora mirobrigensis]|uniref:Carbohydrate ABC transporter membrane protein 2, CUT1 family (TC 3.A.1.1.-) n=1 Tax=Micromonospora mirobrigensis TaxID=262898 RepID=A0A1C5AIQ7_9ACTN|nr:carbohydrate ABC transporter permease [Micromonospora mirobrigensis]SCF45100.1 carbohydrate ABC transporter membrane protein 2, CUT1 family (TC 3.A.1.1.-) [Micromonospora mirobrigensis]
MKRIALNGAGLLVALFAAFPVYWMVATSLKPNREIFASTPRPVPAQPTLEHYREILTGNLIPGVTFLDFFLNSVLVAVATVLLSGLVALFAATAVARFRFKLRTSFLIMLLVVQMIPLEALVIPLFLMIQRLGLYNTLPSLILTYLGFSLPFAVWMLRGFVAAVPKELEEAAAIDGASRMQTFRRILFPLVAPGLVATSIFSFITAWNELIFALTFVNDQSRYTLPVAMTFFFGRDDTAWGSVMAASTLFTLPVIVFFLLVQRRMVSGLVAGAVKG